MMLLRDRLWLGLVVVAAAVFIGASVRLGIEIVRAVIEALGETAAGAAIVTAVLLTVLLPLWIEVARRGYRYGRLARPLHATVRTEMAESMNLAVWATAGIGAIGVAALLPGRTETIVAWVGGVVLNVVLALLRPSRMIPRS